MPNQPHHDDDQAKKPADAGQAPPPAPDTPPRQAAMPNMSLDGPEETFEAAEVVEEAAVPAAEAAPLSDALVVDDDAVIEEVESVPAAEAAKPDSDVFLADPGEAAPIEETPVSEVLDVEAIVEEAEPVEEAAEVAEEEPILLEAEEVADEPVEAAVPVDAEPDLSALFAESVAEAAPVERSVAEAAPVDVEPDLSALFAEPAAEAASAEAEPDLSALFAEAAPVEPSAPEAEASAPAADLPLEEAVAEEFAQAAPASAVEPEEFAFVDEIAEAAAAGPSSTVIAADEVVAGRASEIVAAPEAVAAAPASEVLASQEPIEQSAETSGAQDVPVVEEPVEEIVAAEDAFEEAAEIAPDSAVLAAAEPAEEIAEAAPGSEVVAAEEGLEEPAEFSFASDVVVAEEPVEEIAEAAPGSEVVAAEEALEEPTEVAPGSAVIAAEEPVEEIAEAAPESAIVAAEEALEEPTEVAPGSAVLAAEEPVEEIAEVAPASAIVAAEEAIEEPAAIAPGSAVVAAAEPVEEIAEAAPGSAVVAAEEAIEEPAEIAPGSAVVAAEEPAEFSFDSAVVAAQEPAEEIAEAGPESAVAADEAIEEPAEIAPGSAVVAAEEPAEYSFESAMLAAQEPVEETAEAAPASEVVAAEEAVEEVAEAAPESAVIAADEAVEEVAEAAPGSAVLFAEGEVEEIAEAAPASELVEAEEVAEEVEEAAPLSDVFAADEVEEVVEAASAAEAEYALAEEAPASGEIFEEAAEAVDDVSSATRKSEAVLGDEAAAAPASAVEDAEALEVPASGVVFDEDEVTAERPRPAAAGTVNFEQTLAFEPPPASAAKKTDDDDLLVTEEEVTGTSEASAVNLGDMPRKGSSVTGIDKVAEALESGTDLSGKRTAASVEFDDLLEDLGDSNEGEITAKKGKKTVDEDGSTEMDAAVVQEAFGLAEAPSAAKKKDKKDKKGKAPAKATGDDIDIDDVFSEEPVEAAEAEEAEAVEEFAEADAEAVEAEDAEAVEEFAEADAVELSDEGEEIAEGAEALDDEEVADAAEAFDEEIEAADAEEAEATDDDEMADFDDDIKPAKAKGKKGKTAHQRDEDEEDEDDDFRAKKKKGKKEKPAPAPKQRGMALPLLGGMFVAGLLLVGALGAAWFFVPEEIKKLAEMNLPPPPPKPPEGPKKTKGDEARQLFAEGKYKDAYTALDKSDDPADLGTRGDARWLEYYKDQTDKQAPLDKDAPPVKQALADLDKGNKLRAKQIAEQLEAAVKQKELNDQIAKLTTDKGVVDKQLTDAKAEKDRVDKVVDAVADVLVKAKHIDDKNDFDAVKLQKIIKDLGEDRDTLGKVNKILDDEKFKGKGEVGLMEVLKLKKQADDNYAAVNKVLEDEKSKDQGAKGVLEIVDARNKMTKDRDDLLATVKEAFKEFIDGKIVKEDADARKQLIEGAKLARQKAESPLSIPLGQLGMSLGGIGSGTSKLVEDAFSTTRTVTELKWYETREPFIQKPHEKLDTHIKILQDRSNNDPKALAAIVREADWVMSKEAKTDEEARAKASYVKGLTFRNEQKFAEATKTFKETIDTLQPLMKVGPWKQLVGDSYRELTDPAFYYLPRMAKFQAEDNLPAALNEANIALKAMPDEGRLYAARGLIRFEMARIKDGKKAKIDDNVQKDIRADAEAAAKDEKLAAESAYINGLLEEELGKLDMAEKLYRQAIKLHAAGKGPADEAGKYRVALGRLLLRDRSEAPPAPAEEEKKKKDDKGARLPAEPAETTVIFHPWSLLAVSAVIAQQPIEELEDKETLARLKDVMEEAEKLKLSKNKKLQGQGYCLMGAALSKLGKRTEGLKEYAKGLELLYPGIETKEINDLIGEHPAFQQPDVSNIPNPVMAERHFGEGMHLYWSKKYVEAEAQFRQSVKYYDKDARYQYFLGLAQLHQRTKVKRDAALYAFEAGARLEARSVLTNPYATREVNQSLERIQGELRQLLNYYRYRPSTEPETKKEVE